MMLFNPDTAPFIRSYVLPSFEAAAKSLKVALIAAPVHHDAEIEAAIAAALTETGVTSLKQMGVVMKATQARLTGKTVDGKALSEKVRARLA